MADSIYNSLLWGIVRAQRLALDGSRCTVSRLLGGECSGSLHVHHIHAVSEGGVPFDLENTGTSCAAHHPMWEALRRILVDRMMRPADESPPRCRHFHRSAEARRLCESRMARQRAVAA